MSAVIVDKVSHHYTEGANAHPVLDELSASIPSGEITALVGQSGCGKSTLLHLIGGLDPVQHGTISVFGTPISSMNDRERTLFRRSTIGLVYQSFNLIPTLTVHENVALPLVMNGVPRSQQEIRTRTMLDAVGLNKRKAQFPDRLSGGEQQRIAIARALVHEPALILADEPTGNLDATAGRKCLDMLLGVVRDHRSTLLLVTHSTVVANRADRILRLEGGKLHADDTSVTSW